MSTGPMRELSEETKKSLHAGEMMNMIEVQGKLISASSGKYGDSRIVVTVSTHYGRSKESELKYMRFLMPKELSPAFRMGQYVHVTGYARGGRYHDEATDRDRISQTFVATSVEPAKSILEDGTGVPGRFYDQYCRAFFIGKFGGLEPSKPPFIRFRFLTNVPEQKKQSCELFINDHERARHMPVKDIKEGETVAMWCRVFTPQKKFAFDDIILEDIQPVAPYLTAEEVQPEEETDIDSFLE